MFQGHQFDVRIPDAVLSVMSIFGVIASFLLPETLNAKLPETLEDAQKFGKRIQSYMPVELKSSKSDKIDTASPSVEV
jgi:hypothetical protein